MPARREIEVVRRGRTVVRRPLEGPLTSLGRDATNAVVLDDPAVSRCHAVVSLDGEGRAWLQDVGSRNGTFLGAERVTRARLLPGAAFRIARFECHYLVDGDPAATAGEAQDTRELAVPGGPAAAAEVFIGASPAARELRRTIERVAPARVPVLVTGESGSGKGVVGRLLHDLGPRRAGPFLAVNCAAIPAELVESELFGHRRGAFTGALADRAGRFETASGGTLLLDEVGDMSLAAQAKILRAIEDRTIERVGDPTPVPIDVRVVAATNRDIDREVAEGRFRADLFYRLAAVRIAVPPLRARPEDVVLLANHVLGQLIDEIPSARGSHFLPETLAALAAHPWPGNVRELRNVVAQALLLKDGPEIRPTDLRLAAPAPRAQPRGSLAEAEAERIREALPAHGWNLTRAAEALGISRRTLRERARALGLERPRRPGR